MSEDRFLRELERVRASEPDNPYARERLEHLSARSRRPIGAYGRRLRPREELTPSQWAEKYVRAYKGPFAGKPINFSNGYEWQREPLDWIFGPFKPGEKRREATVMKGSQLGFTLIMLLGLLYWFIDRRTSVALISPRNPDATDRAAEIAELVRGSPGLAEHFKHIAGRVKRGYWGQEFQSRSTQSMRELISWSAPIIAVDERDHHGGLEYDLESVLGKRSGGYPREIFARLSTPTYPGIGVAEAFEEGDQRRFFVRCPFSQCAAWQPLTYEDNIRFERNEDLNLEVRSARFQCSACHWEWNDAARIQAFSSGEWVSAYQRDHRSYEISRLYSPTASAGEFVRELRGARGDELKTREAHNQLLARPYISQVGRPPKAMIRERITAEVPWKSVPDGVVRLCVGVDVQGDAPGPFTFPLEFRAYRADGFAFVIYYDILKSEDEVVEFLGQRFDGRVIDRALFDASDGDHVKVVERIVYRCANAQAAKWDNSISASFTHANLIEGKHGHSGWGVHRELAVADNLTRFYPDEDGNRRIVVAKRKRSSREKEWINHYNKIKRIKEPDKRRPDLSRWFYVKVGDKKCDYPFAGALAEVAFRIEMNPREVEQARQAARKGLPNTAPATSQQRANVRRGWFKERRRWFGKRYC